MHVASAQEECPQQRHMQKHLQSPISCSYLLWYTSLCTRCTHARAERFVVVKQLCLYLKYTVHEACVAQIIEPPQTSGKSAMHHHRL